MSTISVKSFRDDANRIYQSYESGFAGRPRANRDLALLDSIIEELSALIQTAHENEELRKTPAFVDVLQTAVDNLTLYKNERTAIQEAQADPSLVQDARLATKREQLESIYFRHFANQNRATRDVRLLEELVSEGKQLLAEYERVAQSPSAPEGIADVISDFKDSVDMYQTEVEKIVDAQRSAGIEERIGIYATLANEQFRLFTAQFAGKARVSRRPEFLARMIENLEDYRNQMRSIQELPDVTSPTNTNNINIVESYLTNFKNELAQIRAERASTSPVELSNALGSTANDLFQQYNDNFAGQMRATRDPQLLSDICDGLWNVSKQMEALLDNETLPHNSDNFEIVSERLITYGREYALVLEAIEANNPEA